MTDNKENKWIITRIIAPPMLENFKFSENIEIKNFVETWSTALNEATKEQLQ